MKEQPLALLLAALQGLHLRIAGAILLVILLRDLSILDLTDVVSLEQALAQVLAA